MDRNQAKEFYPILQAFAEGKVIETRTDTSTLKRKDTPNDWTEMKEIEYWNNTEYRIKPEPKYRPFNNANECWQEMQRHQPFGWVTDGDSYRPVLSVGEDCVITASFVDGNFIQSFEMAMDTYIFADGTPFGVKIKEE